MTVLLADDHPLFRAGVRSCLEKSGICKSIVESDNGIDALERILRLNPQIVILDIRMPGKSGLEILSELYKRELTTKVILLTMYKNPAYFYKAISLGVKGYLSKDDAENEIVQAVKQVAHGESYISGSLNKQLIIKEKSKQSFRENIEAISSLTNMEKGVIKLIGDWKTNNEIAEVLFISPRTAGNHRTNISNKLNLHGTHSLIKFAIENRDLF